MTFQSYPKAHINGNIGDRDSVCHLSVFTMMLEMKKEMNCSTDSG